VAAIPPARHGPGYIGDGQPVTPLSWNSAHEYYFSLVVETPTFLLSISSLEKSGFSNFVPHDQLGLVRLMNSASVSTRIALGKVTM
jgi:hypothetical protein